MKKWPRRVMLSGSEASGSTNRAAWPTSASSLPLRMTDRRSFLIARDDAILELLTRPLFLLVEIILQEAAGTGVAQLADGTFLDLADALACHPQLLAHLFQGVIVVVCQAEAQLDDLPLARGELGQRLAQFIAQHLVFRDFNRPAFAHIFDDVAERVFLFLGEWRVEREDLFGPDQQFVHALRRHSQALADNLRRWLPSQFLVKLARHAFHAHHLFHDIDGQANDARPLQNGAGDALLNPPGRVGGETKAFAVIELGHSANQADIPLADQVFERESLAHVFFRNTDHQSQVSLDQLVARIAIPLFGAFGQV